VHGIQTVHLTSVQLRDFRSYRSASAVFAPALNIVSGENGQGKTNLLEAIRLISVGRSFRGATDGEMVSWGQPSGTITGAIDDGPVRQIVLTIAPGERKQGTIDGAALNGLAELVGVLRTVAVSSDEIEQQFGSQTGRRRMIDVMISQVDRGYLTELRRCRTIVAQLNAVYRDPANDDALCDVLERQLAETSLRINRRREAFFHDFCRAVEGHFSRLFGTGNLVLESRPTLPGKGELSDLDHAVDVLRESRHSARRAGFAVRGAHRDRFRVLLDGRDIESHASKGQVKIAYLAWKLAEGDFIERETMCSPVWLIDDPFSELDARRAVALLVSAEQRGQVILTNARTDGVEMLRNGHAHHLRVHDGIVEGGRGV